MGFEPMIRVLQTRAFPLGHVAIIKKPISNSFQGATWYQPVLRAGEETRTLNLLLGKETFYQLNYTRLSL